MTHAWLDVSAGVAGDMLLGALLDAGAPVAGVQAALDALVPGSVRIDTEPVVRGGQRATKARVRVLVDDPPHRTWASIRGALGASSLADVTRDRSLAAFARLADAEARAHGIDAEDVHFHEVGALDSIADVVGVCEALRLLGVTTVSASPVALGAGRVRAAHGDIPVPVPAVAELAVGWRTVAASGFGAAFAPEPGHTHDHRHSPAHDHAHSHHHDHGHSNQHDHHDAPAPVTTPGEPGELATPTGLALVRALAASCEGLPALAVASVGVGAGGRDFATHPNVVRVVVGEPTASSSQALGADMPSPRRADAKPSAEGGPGMVELRANVDDLDPRWWPGVLEACLAAGAADAWLVPIHMKKGRPAFTLHALADAAAHDAVVDAMLAHTTTLGVRESPVRRTVLDRHWVEVSVDGLPVSVKVGSRGGRVVNAAAEYESVVALASATGWPQVDAAQRVAAAIVAAGLVPGATLTPRDAL